MARKPSRRRWSTPLQWTMVTVLLLMALPPLAPPTIVAGQAAAAKPRVVEEWVWSPSMAGSVTGLYISSGGLVYALVESHGPLVYALNTTTGEVVWATRISLEGNVSSMLALKGVIYVSSCTCRRNASVIEVYGGGRSGFKPLYTSSIEAPLYRILALQPTPAGDVVVGGARYRVGRGYQYYAGLISKNGTVWSDFWGGARDEYFNLISLGPDYSVCLAGPPGGLACYDYSGNPLFRENISFKPLAILNLGSGRVLVGGVLNSTGILYMKAPGGGWLKRTGSFIPTALAPGAGGTVYVVGVIAPAPYKLALLEMNVNGTPLLLGVGNKTYRGLIPLAASARENLVAVGGALNGRPFVELLLVLKNPPATTTPPASPTATGRGSRLILVEEVALAVSAGLLAVSLAVFKPWRWRRGGRGG